MYKDVARTRSDLGRGLPATHRHIKDCDKLHAATSLRSASSRQVLQTSHLKLLQADTARTLASCLQHNPDRNNAAQAHCMPVRKPSACSGGTPRAADACYSLVELSQSLAVAAAEQETSPLSAHQRMPDQQQQYQCLSVLQPNANGTTSTAGALPNPCCRLLLMAPRRGRSTLLLALLLVPSALPLAFLCLH